MPGRKTEKAENSIQALVREIKEEVGVDLITQQLKYFATFAAQTYGKEKGIKVKINVT